MSAGPRTRAHDGEGLEGRNDRNAGYHLAYVISAALVAEAIVLAATVLRGERSDAQRAGAAAERTARSPCPEPA